MYKNINKFVATALSVCILCSGNVAVAKAESNVVDAVPTVQNVDTDVSMQNVSEPASDSNDTPTSSKTFNKQNVKNDKISKIYHFYEKLSKWFSENGAYVIGLATTSFFGYKLFKAYSKSNVFWDNFSKLNTDEFTVLYNNACENVTQSSENLCNNTKTIIDTLGVLSKDASDVKSNLLSRAETFGLVGAMTIYTMTSVLVSVLFDGIIC